MLKHVDPKVKPSHHITSKRNSLKHRNTTVSAHLVTDGGQNLGTIDWETANHVFEGIAWTDSIDIFSDSDTGNLNYDSKDAHVDSVHQK